MALVALVPLSKIALTNRPIIEVIDQKLRSAIPSLSDGAAKKRHMPPGVSYATVAVGVACNLAELGIAVVFPNFDNILSIMGSGLCMAICVILPGCFYLALTRRQSEIERKSIKRSLVKVMVAVSVPLSILGAWSSFDRLL